MPPGEASSQRLRKNQFSVGANRLGQRCSPELRAPGVRPPGHWISECMAHAGHYRALLPLLSRLALGEPRRALLGAVAEAVAYRAIRSPAEEGVALPGALGPVVNRLREQTVSLRTIAGWPGMGIERASRLLNGLYLTNSLLATQFHPTVVPDHAAVRGSLGSRRGQ